MHFAETALYFALVLYDVFLAVAMSCTTHIPIYPNLVLGKSSMLILI